MYTATAVGHSELYKMGFDGASIGLMRSLSPEKIKRLIEILNDETFHSQQKQQQQESEIT